MGKGEIEDRKVLGLPLQDVVNRIEEIVERTGTERTSWGETKRCVFTNSFGKGQTCRLT
ncbi:MAG: hypothetical protein J7J76_06085 [Candidatus Latescibacteria bacterium]|nr:hypothetical protein [Candidatus Latescibacterota bacterium]